MQWLARALALACACPAAITASRAHSQIAAPPVTSSPLRNTASIPHDVETSARLDVGDEALRALRAVHDESASAAAWETVFEAWHAALAQAAPGAAVPGFVVRADRAFERTSDRSDGIECAVLARVSTLEPLVRAQWSRRFEPLAAARLATLLPQAAADAAFESALPDRHALARLLRDEPLCEAALRAGLCALDLACADGALAQAEGLAHELALQGAALAPTSPQTAALLEAVARRASALRTQLNAPSQAQPSSAARAEAAWEHGRLRCIAAHPIAPPGRAPLWDPVEVEPGLARGLQAGLAVDPALSDARAGGFVALQTPAAIWWGPPDLSDLRAFTARELLRPVRPDLGPEIGVHAAPGWVLAPTLRGRRLWAVVGRSLEGFAANAVVCIELPDLAQSGALAPALPRLAWMRSGHELFDASFARSTTPGSDAPELPEDCEFQPGVVAHGELVLVRARSRASSARQWLLALAADSGALLWSCETADGSFLLHDDPRLRLIDTNRAARAGSAGPLLLADGRVFDATHLGLGSLVRVHDGALVFAQRYHRRESAASDNEELGGATGALLALDARRCAWFPADADRAGVWSLDFPARGELAVLHEPLGAQLRAEDASAHLATAHNGLPLVPRFDPGPRIALLGASDAALRVLWERDGRWQVRLHARADVSAAALVTAEGARTSADRAEDSSADSRAASATPTGSAPLDRASLDGARFHGELLDRARLNGELLGASVERVPPGTAVGAALGGARRCVVSDDDGVWVLDATAELRVEQFLNWDAALAEAGERLRGPFVPRPAVIAAAGAWLWIATPTHWLVFRSDR